VIPLIIYLFSVAGQKLAKTTMSVRNVFLANTGAILPLSILLWIAFVIPMLFVNVTFIIQSASDPFGWGWDFFGTANIPWHQFVPRLIPWLQAALLLFGLYLSLRNLKRSFQRNVSKPKELFLLIFPMAMFLAVITLLMLLFYTN
jgi:hypothetical protein